MGNLLGKKVRASLMRAMNLHTHGKKKRPARTGTPHGERESSLLTTYWSESTVSSG